MRKMKLGILSPSNIAFQRFLPSLEKSNDFEYIGVAIANKDEWFKSSGTLSDELEKIDREKANRFKENYGGKVYNSYMDLLKDDTINAVYIPLPPILHFQWGKKALDFGKHVLLEKPSTTNYNNTLQLVKFAEEKGLSLHENYMFQFHNQLKVIKDLIEQGELGEIRTYKMSFGFPKREGNDFRYNKSMGGGSLLDCGGYPIKLASILLGDTTKVVYSKLNYKDDFDVDIFGVVVMENKDGISAQISFGMDNSYQCQLEVWGSKKTLIAPRIFTAGATVNPTVILKSSVDETSKDIECDDQFLKSIEYFGKCIIDKEVRLKNYHTILKQSELIEKVITKENGK